MKKLLVTGTAALVAAIAFAASPAAAGNVHFNIGIGGYGGGWGPGYYGQGYGGIYVAPAPIVVAPQNNWAAHVSWCSAKYGSYNPANNTYITFKGYVKQCNSPYI